MTNDIWAYLEILSRSNKTWLFGKGKDQIEKINALEQLARIGKPAIINKLLPFLKDKDQQIRTATMLTINILFSRLKAKKEYYNTLKFCKISVSDLDYFESQFVTEDFVTILNIGSLNRSGYIREKAVEKLGKLKSPKGLSFVIYRLADWVPNVHKRAKESLYSFLTPYFREELMHNLSIFEWLNTVERIDLSEIYQDVIRFLIVEHRSETLLSFYKIQDKERQILAKELSKNTLTEDVFDLIVNDKHFLVRILALNHFESLNSFHREKLLNDKSSRIRQSTLYKFKDESNFKVLIEKYLADRSGGIRHLARFYLKESGINFKDVYTSNLNEQKNIIGSILGLHDLEAKESEKLIAAFLHHDKTKITKIAFYALSNMNSIHADTFAKNHLFTEKLGLRNQIIEFLGRSRKQEVLAMAREHYKKSDNDMKLSLLKLYSLIGGYATISDLMLATIDDSEIIRNQSLHYIRKWKSEAISLFSVPSENEKTRGVKIYHLVNEVHTKNKLFSKNPIEGLNFYFQ